MDFHGISWKFHVMEFHVISSWPFPLCRWKRSAHLRLRPIGLGVAHGALPAAGAPSGRGGVADGGDPGVSRRGGWEAGRMAARFDPTSRRDVTGGWNVGESYGNRDRNGDIWPVWYTTINDILNEYHGKIIQPMGNQCRYIIQPTSTWWYLPVASPFWDREDDGKW